ncbi:anti-sigma F factor antagonist [Hathewaya histolytica]|uniref:Anti-sigma F factor antagonist n=1 Tax=Hathewaya histolytica TaxID=1498 RepID=A0A4U9RL37_HATHI|nr:anti-sigma F factor antagonist [Hathewaya histolytica]VTQ92649.1 anti-sigma factor F antagonist [Hathewaya histolytica]
MYLEFENLEDKLVVHMRGELDHHSAEEVRNKIDDRLDRDSIAKLIMDFNGITFMDSSGIGVVIGRYKKLNMKNGDIAVIRVNNPVNKVFELSGMYKIIKNYGTLEDALKHM